MAHELGQKRLDKLKEPRIAEEVKTIRIMTKIYCTGHGHVKNLGLCEKCQDFVDYATKRLACCPFGSEKPVCKKCKVHCFQKDYKRFAKEVMGYAGPRMIWSHPILAAKHIVASFRKSPEKPRNQASKPVKEASVGFKKL